LSLLLPKCGFWEAYGKHDGGALDPLLDGVDLLIVDNISTSDNDAGSWTSMQKVSLFCWCAIPERVGSSGGRPAARIPAAVDYERTLILAIEVSNKSWVLAAQVPGLPHTKAKRTIDPEAEALLVAIAGYRARAVATGCRIERVIAVYEAGWSGFWLARWLMSVVQPSSVPVDRRMRRAKSDGIDSELLLRTLLAWLRGEPRVCSMVPVPDEADEDARRCVRERTELISERVGLTNRIGAVLATLGVSDYNPLLRNRGRRLAELRTALGEPLPANAHAKIKRLLARLQLVRCVT
jgi:transposase